MELKQLIEQRTKSPQSQRIRIEYYVDSTQYTHTCFELCVSRFLVCGCLAVKTLNSTLLYMYVYVYIYAVSHKYVYNTNTIQILLLVKFAYSVVGLIPHSSLLCINMLFSFENFQIANFSKMAVWNFHWNFFNTMDIFIHIDYWICPYSIVQLLISPHGQRSFEMAPVQVTSAREQIVHQLTLVTSNIWFFCIVHMYSFSETLSWNEECKS